MKKTFIIPLLLSIILVSGCNNKTPKQNDSNIFWKSEIQGDEIPDERKPEIVCRNLQDNQGLNSCTIINAKKSENSEECSDGIGVAGCFACQFDCP